MFPAVCWTQSDLGEKLRQRAIYEGATRSYLTEAIAKNTTPNKRRWKTAHVHAAMCNLAHWLTRHDSPTIYRYFALPSLLHKWRHQSGIFWMTSYTTLVSNCKHLLLKDVLFPKHLRFLKIINPLPPNAPLTSRRCILNIYSTNIRTEHFKHAALSLFFVSSKWRLFHNTTWFCSCIIHILNTECAKI
jgi:hypothetical protein